MLRNLKPNSKFKKAIVKITLFCLVFSLLSPVAVLPQQVFADSLDVPSFESYFTGEDLLGEAWSQGVPVQELKLEQDILKVLTEEKKGNWLTKLLDVSKWAKWEAGSQAFQSALSTALNTLAYDAANWVASGGKGQGAAFETRSLGKVFSDSLDAAAGDFLYKFGTEGMGGLNLCQPSFTGVNIKIGLGLVQYQRPRPACTFSEMRNNWEQELRSENFLPRFQNMFEPTSNDLGIALTAQTMFMQETVDKATAKVEQVKLGQGWLDIGKLIDDEEIETPAGTLRTSVEQQLIRNPSNNFAKYTGDALIDAANIFLNQLLIALLNRLIREGLGGDSSKRRGVAYDFEADVSGGGVRAAKERFREIIQPRFDVRGDYDILAELANCPNPNKAGPTNCVITDKFRQAVQARKTVGQAMQEGLLNPRGIFGFINKDLEPRYIDENYPYRSMLILRKFRIVPVGWEVAAQYINKNFGNPITDTGSGTYSQMNLNQMVACFDPCDGYKGFGDGDINDVSGNCAESDVAYDNWCRNLVDPNWVLKAPLNYCAREGYGPELVNEPQVINDQYVINRKDNYCADEQACIKENLDGSCELYGYCTEERRTWNFGSDSCNPLYNTCQTFNRLNGSSVSYLQNTLQYCDAPGCMEYCEDYNYNDGDGQWTCTNITGNKMYFDNDISTCDSANEGCHEFIRVERDKWVDDPPSAGTVPSDDYLNEDGNYKSDYAMEMIYEKELPGYLINPGAVFEGVCYDNEGQMRDTAPAICNNFARQCNADEVGCELYTRVRDGFEIPGKVRTTDICPAECDGYDVYIQQETTFESRKDQYFIPATAHTCSAQANGCDQFTNLDEVAKGGEGIEYYSMLRQCTTNSDITAPFYTWEGTEESGYQLRVYTLQKNFANTNEPKGTACTEAIFNTEPGDAQHDSDCRQFYSKSGKISYYLFSTTITLSTNCHPYRRTELNIDPSVNSSGNCTGDDKNWDSQAQVCYSCKNNGEWKDGACIYMAIPQQGVMCSAPESGCRKYVGNVGNNIRVVLADDFEYETAEGWADGGIDDPSRILIRDISIKRDGKSLYITDGEYAVKKDVSELVQGGKSYVIEFLAKGAANASLSVKFSDGSSDLEFGAITLDGGWNRGELKLEEFDRDVGDFEYLVFDGSREFYLDYIILREVVDNYYLIKDSWNTPRSCDQDIDGEDYIHYMAGCYEYRDRYNETHFLKSFSDICPESAVGCELMIDTQNYTPVESGSWQDNSVYAPADQFIYMVYDQRKLCTPDNKGCQFFGRPNMYGIDVISYQDVYLKNNPDRYETTLCSDDDVGCAEYTDEKGSKYSFKDPGDKVCEYRAGWNGSYDWWQKKVKRCDNSRDGVIQYGTEDKMCLNDNECAEGIKCILDDWDEECATDGNEPPKTIGIGGAGNRIEQPMGDFAGVCPAYESGCTELIDPVSKPAVNLVFNSDFSQDVDGVGGPDGWITDTNRSSYQSIELVKNTLYIAKGIDIGAEIESTCGGYYLEYNEDLNIIQNTLQELSENKKIDPNQSMIFYSGNSEDSENCIIRVYLEDLANLGGNPEVELKEAMLGYQIASGLDNASCNGQVDFNEGCILFNKRSVAGGNNEAVHINDLIYDADDTSSLVEAGQAPATCDGEDCDSNELLKVTPDRICDKWLACKSQVAINDARGEEEKVCYDIGICDGLNEKNQCDSWVLADKVNQDVDIPADSAQYANISGYSKAGVENIKDLAMKGGYPLGKMEQYGGVTTVPNGNFELYGSNNYPTGWRINSGGAWDDSKFKVINDPLTAQEESIVYPLEGRSFLKYSPSQAVIESEDIEVEPNENYILSLYANTLNFNKVGTKFSVEITNCSAGDCSINVSNSLDWRKEIAEFRTGDDTDRIKVRLYGVFGANNTRCDTSEELCVGNVYVDDIKIRPALEVRYEESIHGPWYTQQSCRLYPENDSLSCSYSDDAGKLQKGWWGYCLEYDRSPGNSDACLLWWPVDRVRGDGVDEGAGYMGRYPLYYCLEGEMNFEAGNWQQVSDGELDLNLNQERILEFTEIVVDLNIGPEIAWYEGGSSSPIYRYWVRRANAPANQWIPQAGLVAAQGGTNGSSYPQILGGDDGCDDGCYYINLSDINDDNGQPIGPIEAIKIKNDGGEANSDGHGLSIANFFDNFVCMKIAKVVTETGNYKAWLGRINEGNYEIPINKLVYQSDYEPFGSALPPAPLHMPELWDGNTEGGVQPLSILPFTSNQARAGTPYYYTYDVENIFGQCSESRNICIKNSSYYFSCPITTEICGNSNIPNSSPYSPPEFKKGISSLQKIFAQSYGAWKWNGDAYTKDDTISWEPPEDVCGVENNLSRPNDYCAILPIVDSNNIKVNGGNLDDITITKNGFINLTFNTEVNDNQEPLVMYKVDWGDGETTVVSGVELRDRPHENNPHSVYHLYDYWDLLKKYSQKAEKPEYESIDCGTLGECRVTPSVLIKDNWGWYNNGTIRNDGGSPDAFNRKIIIKEK